MEKLKTKITDNKTKKYTQDDIIKTAVLSFCSGVIVAVIVDLVPLARFFSR
ncbi:MAG: hypothetical protein ACOX0Z_00490 [Candidatus Nanosyncoccaceae bacterium]|jgi:hypothetical protein